MPYVQGTLRGQCGWSTKGKAGEKGIISLVIPCSWPWSLALPWVRRGSNNSFDTPTPKYDMIWDILRSLWLLTRGQGRQGWKQREQDSYYRNNPERKWQQLRPVWQQWEWGNVPGFWIHFKVELNFFMGWLNVGHERKEMKQGWLQNFYEQLERPNYH